MQDWINIRKIECYKSQNQQNLEEKYDHLNRFRKKMDKIQNPFMIIILSNSI